MKTYLAFDPGGTTGWCRLEINEDGYHIFRGELIKQNHHADLEQKLKLWQPDVLITERFDYRARQKHAELISVEYIGILRLWSIKNYVPLVEQQQLKGKTGLWTDAKLKTIALYSSTTGGHSNDAVRQMLWYVTMTLDDDYFIQEYRRCKDR